MGDTGIKPDVQRISDLVVVFRILAQQLGGIEIEPGINALVFHP